MLDIDVNGQLSLVAGAPRKPYIARSVAFFDKGQAVLVCYLESYEVAAYTINPWSTKWTHVLRHRIGYATLSADERLLFTSNLKGGVDTYSIPPAQHIRSLPHPIHRNLPLTLCSAFGAALTLAGSDDGSPRVFDQRIGSLVQSLPHGQGSLVQTVTAHSRDGHCVLATGSSDTETAVEIKIWAEQQVERQPEIRSTSIDRLSALFLARS